MSGLRLFFVLLALSYSGLAHASIAFDGAPRASDEELDRMRGGFVVNLRGLEFLMAFSIDRLSYINGELVSAIRLNPLALTPLAQIGQAIADLPVPVAQDIALPVTTIDAPASAALDAALSAGTPKEAVTPPADVPAAANAGTVEAAPVQPSLDQTASSGGAEANVPSPPPAETGVGQATASTNTQVSTQGMLTLIQNGSGNTIALPSNLDVSSMTTLIQNSLNDQVIRNITTMNITIATQALAAQARINAMLNQMNSLR